VLGGGQRAGYHALVRPPAPDCLLPPGPVKGALRASLRDRLRRPLTEPRVRRIRAYRGPGGPGYRTGGGP